MTSALRILRLLRVLKLFNNVSRRILTDAAAGRDMQLPSCAPLLQITELQIILAGLSRGVSSVSYIGLLMLLEMYVFGIVALYYFRKNDPVSFESNGVLSAQLGSLAVLRP